MCTANVCQTFSIELDFVEVSRTESHLVAGLCVEPLEPIQRSPEHLAGPREQCMGGEGREGGRIGKGMEVGKDRINNVF